MGIPESPHIPISVTIFRYLQQVPTTSHDFYPFGFVATLQVLTS